MSRTGWVVCKPWDYVISIPFHPPRDQLPGTKRSCLVCLSHKHDAVGRTENTEIYSLNVIPQHDVCAIVAQPTGISHPLKSKVRKSIIYTPELKVWFLPLC